MIQAANLDTETIVASLRRIMPPTALIDVGIGRGIGAMHQWRSWDVPAAWLVDAESTQLAWTETLPASHPGWRVHVATLAEADGQAPCYRASNPAETGLVPTSKLAALWPNLREEEHVERATTRLDTLLARDEGVPAGAGWWLVVDCLPALRILQGATDTLERCSVLWLRTLLQPLPENETGTMLEELRVYLAPLGFRCVQVTEGNHPALGDALFVRDWAQRLQPIIVELQASNERDQLQYRHLETSLATQEAATKAMFEEREEYTKIAATREAQLSKLEVEKAELVSKLGASEKAHNDLARKLAVLENEAAAMSAAMATAQTETTARTEERDAQAKLAAERQAKLESIAKEKADLTGKFETLGKTHAELAQKLTTSIEQQGAAGDAVKAVQTTLAERTSERDAQLKLAAERQVKLDTLAKNTADLSGKFDALDKVHAELADKHAASIQQLGKTTDALKAAQAALTERTDEWNTQTKLATECQAKIDALVEEKSELFGKLEKQTKLAQDCQAQLDALSKEKTILAEKLVTVDKAMQDLSMHNEALQTQANQVTKARDEQAKLATERAAQISKLSKECDDLSEQRQSLKSEAQGKDAAIATLNERIAEQDHRERQLVEEIVRAEAQIELIKDLLLREGGM